jgi:large subunit ribosomal protein L35
VPIKENARCTAGVLTFISKIVGTQKMPKMKTRRGASKRFKVTKDGRIKYTRAGKRHILTKKNSKRKRQLRAAGYLNSGDAGLVKRLLPNA